MPGDAAIEVAVNATEAQIEAAQSAASAEIATEAAEAAVALAETEAAATMAEAAAEVEELETVIDEHGDALQWLRENQQLLAQRLGTMDQTLTRVEALETQLIAALASMTVTQLTQPASDLSTTQEVPPNPSSESGEGLPVAETPTPAPAQPEKPTKLRRRI